MDRKKTWAQEMYEINHNELMEIGYCLWLQCMLEEYEKQKFPNGKNVLGAFEWSSDNMPYDKYYISKLLNSKEKHDES